jgi:hypothetical protein
MAMTSAEDVLSTVLPPADAATPPCLSLYQPTHRHYPETQQNPIRFRNLVKSLESSLRKKYGADDVRRMLEPFHSLGADETFWTHQYDGLAVLATATIFRVYRLQRRVPERAVVADSFHTKPLLRILQSADRFHVLGLSRKRARLFVGNRDTLDEVVLPESFPARLEAVVGDRERRASELAMTVAAGGGQVYQGAGEKDVVRAETERFFRAVDEAVIERYSRPSGLPLILATLPEHHGTFRRLSHNRALVDGGIDIHPDALTVEALRERAWEVVEPSYLGRLAALREEFEAGRRKGLASDDLDAVAEAAVMSRVGTLLIEADREVPGRIDPATGRVERADISQPDVDDTLDDLAEMVLGVGGRVVVVPGARMPTDTGLAAIYRF